MSKNLSVSELCDVYGSLLTAKQREMVTAYYDYDLSIAEIADQVGIPDPYYFSTRFHKFSGTSPREYRKRKISARNG